MEPARGALLAVIVCLAVVVLNQATASAPPPQEELAAVRGTPQGKSAHLKDAGKTGERHAAHDTVSVGAAGEGEACVGESGGPGDGSCERLAAQSTAANAGSADIKQASRNPQTDVLGSEKAAMGVKKPPENQHVKLSTEQTIVNSGQSPTTQKQESEELQNKQSTPTQNAKSTHKEEPPKSPTNVQKEKDTEENAKLREEKRVAEASMHTKHENDKLPAKQQQKPQMEPIQDESKNTKAENAIPPTLQRSEVREAEINKGEKKLPSVKASETKPPMEKSSELKPQQKEEIKAELKNAQVKVPQVEEKKAEPKNAQVKAPQVEEKKGEPKKAQVTAPQVEEKRAEPKNAQVNDPQVEEKKAEPKNAQVKVPQVEEKKAEPKNAQVKAPQVEEKKGEPKSAQVKAPQVEEKKGEPKNAQVKAPEVTENNGELPAPKPTELKSVASKEAEMEKTAAKPSHSKVAENKPKESKNAPNVNSADSKQQGTKPTQAKSTSATEAQIKTEDVKPSESVPTQVKPAVSQDHSNDALKVKPKDIAKENIKELPATEEWPGRAEQPARILAVMPYNARSHFEAFRPLLVALAQRGHHVDVVSHFPLQGAAPPGYRDIAVNGSFPSFEDAVDLDLVADLNVFTDAVMTWHETLDVCTHVLDTPQLRSLINSNEKYDLVLNEIFGAECLAGFAHKFNTPVVGMVSSVAPPGALDRVGNPESPAYVSNYYLPFVPPLSFWQRAASALYGTALRRLKTLLCDRASDSLARRFFGEGLPSSAQLAARTALVLVNSHPAVNQPRPLVPAVVEVGGLHIGEPRPLPQDLEQLVSGPKGAHGVVVVSLGTMVRLASFPSERLAALWAALGALPQLVLVKSKEDLPGGAPPNVYAFPWLPQFDLLSHPRTRLLLSHGGLLSLQEAVTAGVPVLGMPLFSDQRLNVRSLEVKGAALLVEHWELTHERLSHALQQLLNDPSYQSNAQTLRAQFVDRPVPPLRSAVWWVEYTLRHNGAPHLRCAAADMPQHELLLLDVAAALALAVAVALGALWVLLAAVYRAIRFGTVRSKPRLPTVDAEGRPKRYTKHKLH